MKSVSFAFSVLLHPYLVVKSSAGPKLPSNLRYALPRNSPVEFEVKFKDPFKQVASVSTDWKFGDDSPIKRKWQKTRICHTFSKEGKYSLWVMVRVTTKDFGKKLVPPIRKTLHVKGWYRLHFLFLWQFSVFKNHVKIIDFICTFFLLGG